MRINKFLNLLNLYSKDDFHNELDKYIHLLQEEKTKEKNELFSGIQFSIFDNIKRYFPTDTPFLVSFPFLAKRDYIYIITVEIRSPKFNIENKLKSFQCDITAFNKYILTDTVAKLLGKVDLEKRVCKIESISSSHERLGLGSFLLKTLENIMILYQVKEITGWLSPAHFKYRHIHESFYPKNGYSIGFTDKTKESGWIEKELKY